MNGFRTREHVSGRKEIVWIIPQSHQGAQLPSEKEAPDTRQL